VQKAQTPKTKKKQQKKSKSQRRSFGKKIYRNYSRHLHGAETLELRLRTGDSPLAACTWLPVNPGKLLKSHCCNKSSNRKSTKWRSEDAAAKENLIRKLCAQVERAALEMRTSDTKPSQSPSPYPSSSSSPSTYPSQFADLHIKCQEVIF